MLFQFFICCLYTSTLVHEQQLLVISLVAQCNQHICWCQHGILHIISAIHITITQYWNQGKYTTQHMVIIHPPLPGYTSDHGYQYLLCETGNMLPSLTSQCNGHLPYRHREHITSTQLCCSCKERFPGLTTFGWPVHEPQPK